MDLICLILSVYYMFKRADVKRLSEDDFPGTPSGTFHEWSRSELLSLNVFIRVTLTVVGLELLMLLLLGIRRLSVIMLLGGPVLLGGLVASAIHGTRASRLKKVIEPFRRGTRPLAIPEPGSETDPQRLIELGIELAENGQYTDAIGVLRRAIAFNDRSLEGHYNLAVVYGLLAMGTVHVGSLSLEDRMHQDAFSESAIDEYGRALEIDPRHTPSHNNLACVFAGRGELGLAIQELRRSLDIDPNQPDARQQLREMMATDSGTSSGCGAGHGTEA